VRPGDERAGIDGGTAQAAVNGPPPGRTLPVVDGALTIYTLLVLAVVLWRGPTWARQSIGSALLAIAATFVIVVAIVAFAT
jgi:hypothetical protein